MSKIDRRTLLRGLVCGATVAAVGVAAMPRLAASAPIGAAKAGAAAPESLAKDAQVVIVNPRRRRRRYRCRWYRGRRVCGWW